LKYYIHQNINQQSTINNSTNSYNNNKKNNREPKQFVIMTTTELKKQVPLEHCCRHDLRERKIARKKRLGGVREKKTTIAFDGSRIRFSDRAWRNESRRIMRNGRIRKSFTPEKVSEEKINATEGYNDLEPPDRVNDSASTEDWLRRWKCTDCYTVINCDENDKLKQDSILDLPDFNLGKVAQCSKQITTKASDIMLARPNWIVSTTTTAYNKSTKNLVNLDIQTLLTSLGEQDIVCDCRGQYFEMSHEEALDAYAIGL